MSELLNALNQVMNWLLMTLSTADGSFSARSVSGEFSYSTSRSWQPANAAAAASATIGFVILFMVAASESDVEGHCERAQLRVPLRLFARERLARVRVEAAVAREDEEVATVESDHDV